MSFFERILSRGASLHPIECSVLRYCPRYDLLSPSRSQGRAAILVDLQYPRSGAVPLFATNQYCILRFPTPRFICFAFLTLHGRKLVTWATAKVCHCQCRKVGVDFPRVADVSIPRTNEPRNIDWPVGTVPAYFITIIEDFISREMIQTSTQQGHLFNGKYSIKPGGVDRHSSVRLVA